MHAYRDYVGYLQALHCLAVKPPNGTRRGLIPGPLNTHPCVYPLSLAHADNTNTSSPEWGVPLLALMHLLPLLPGLKSAD